MAMFAPSPAAMFDNTGQAQVFLASVLAGFAAGVAYDLLRLPRRLFKLGAVVSGVLDLLFWVVAAGLLALAAGLSGAEGLRLYWLLGGLCGALLWAIPFRWILALAAGKRQGRGEYPGEKARRR